MIDGQLTHGGLTLWTLERSAREAGMTIAALQVLIDNGTLSSGKIGNYVFCNKTQVEAL